MVEVKDVSFRYKPAGPDILHNVSFELDDGNCLAILGNNGAGKSTLLKCIDRILPAGSGTVLVDGTDVFTLGKRELARNIAYVAQNARAADMTVYDSVLLGRRPYIGWDATEHDREVVREVIDLMGIGDYELRSVAELSGGEAQKVMLARALAQEPRLLLLDEPTSNLDPRNQHEALRTVRRVAKERNISVCIILHDLNLAIRYCDRFLFLKDSEVNAYGGEEVMTPENIEAVYRMHVHIMSYMGIPHIIPFPDIRL